MGIRAKELEQGSEGFAAKADCGANTTFFGGVGLAVNAALPVCADLAAGEGALPAAPLCDDARPEALGKNAVGFSVRPGDLAGEAGAEAPGGEGGSERPFRPEKKQPFVVLSHESALAAWRSGQLGWDPGAYQPLDPWNAPGLRVNRAFARDLADRFGLQLPLHAAAWSEKDRRNSKLLRCHIHNSRLPYSYVRVDADLAVATPELALLQASRSVPAAELTLCMSEFFARYSLDPGSNKGFEERSGTLGEPDALQELAAVAVRMKGSCAFRFSVGHMVAESRSPMETILALLLSLPVNMGGYGLPKPLMNPPLNLVTQGSFECALKETVRYGDLVWPDGKLIMEYDSHAFHEDYARDTSRANLLMANGWSVITALPADVFDARRCDQLAANVASVLGRRPESVPIDYGKLRAGLRRDLFSVSGTKCDENRKLGE